MIKDTTIMQTTNGKVSQKFARRLTVAAGSAMGLLLYAGLAFNPSIGLPDNNAHNLPSAQVMAPSASQAVIEVAPVSLNSSYVNTARQAATQAGINPDFFVRQIQQESGFNPNAVSSVGAIGIAQFMPGTAASLGVNPHDPTSSLNGAARHMASLNRMYNGDYAKALAAYNAGPGNVNSAVSRGGGNWQAFLPGETQHYIHTIMG